MDQSLYSIAPDQSDVTQLKSTHTLDHNCTSAHSSIMRELNILRNDISTLKSMRSSSPHPVEVAQLCVDLEDMRSKNSEGHKGNEGPVSSSSGAPSDVGLCALQTSEGVHLE